MSLKIIVACHKECPVPADPAYLPLHVGHFGKSDIGFTPDDTGENISSKNHMYSELTGLFWAWKNLECDYMGLVHYRRYFSLKKTGKTLEDVLSGKDAENLLKKYSVIVPKKRRYYVTSVYNHYSKTCGAEHLDSTRRILAEDCPEYLDSFDRVMKKREAFMFNMMIMGKDLLNEYCSWLFPVLERLENSTDSSGYSDFEMRFVGRVAERLFNVWLEKKISSGEIPKGGVCELPCIYLGKVKKVKKAVSFIAALLTGRKYKASF